MNKSVFYNGNEAATREGINPSARVLTAGSESMRWMEIGALEMDYKNLKWRLKFSIIKITNQF